MPRYSLEIKAKAVELKNDGKTIAQISEILGITQSTIWSWVKKIKAGSKSCKEKKDAVARLFRAGTPLAEISELAEISRPTLTKWLSEYGISTGKKKSPEFRNLALLMRQCGYSRSKVAHIFGISAKTLIIWENAAA